MAGKLHTGRSRNDQVATDVRLYVRDAIRRAQDEPSPEKSDVDKAIERIPRALIPRDFEPGFKVALMNKDLETFHTIAKELHVPVSFSHDAQRYQQAAMAAGLADQDTSVAMTIIEKLAAVEVPRGKVRG